MKQKYKEHNVTLGEVKGLVLVFILFLMIVFLCYSTVAYWITPKEDYSDVYTKVMAKMCSEGMVKMCLDLGGIP